VRASSEVTGYHDSTATSVLTPSVAASVTSPTGGWGVNGMYLVDVVTAASPDIVSTATPRWSEVRNGGSLGGHYKPGTLGVAASANASYTPDYLALGASARVTKELDEKNLVLAGGYSFGHDTIGRTGTPFSIFSRTLTYHGINASMLRVVNAAMVFTATVDAVFEDGDQSKPYRYIPMFAAADAPKIERGASIADVTKYRIDARPLEQLPLDRQRYALTGALAWRLSGTTLRLEERLYADTWSQKATTTDIRYIFDIGERVMLWPHLRFNLQNGVNFWQRAYVGTWDNLPAYRTGDRELGPLLGVTGGGGARFYLGKPGSVEDLVLLASFDGTYTSFADALYVKERLSGLATIGAEVGF